MSCGIILHLDHRWLSPTAVARFQHAGVVRWEPNQVMADAQKPEAVLDKDDPGADVTLRFSYQHSYAAISALEMVEAHKVAINLRTLIPAILPGGNESRAWTFYDAGSGGKMVLFKICFALALHKTAAQRKLPLVRLLVIDSPMKNITPDINREVFDQFYSELFRLQKNELSGWQFILIDQTYHEPPKEFPQHVARLMKKNDQQHPPLISYYTGH